jgi:hypothetical protein
VLHHQNGKKEKKKRLINCELSSSSSDTKQLTTLEEKRGKECP